MSGLINQEANLEQRVRASSHSARKVKRSVNSNEGNGGNRYDKGIYLVDILKKYHLRNRDIAVVFLEHFGIPFEGRRHKYVTIDDFTELDKKADSKYHIFLEFLPYNIQKKQADGSKPFDFLGLHKIIRLKNIFGEIYDSQERMKKIYPDINTKSELISLDYYAKGRHRVGYAIPQSLLKLMTEVAKDFKNSRELNGSENKYTSHVIKRHKELLINK